MILLCQRYKTEDEYRNLELAAALRGNWLSGLFHTIECVDGQSKKWSYGEMLSVAAEKYRGQVCVLANTDILFNDTCSSIRHIVRPNRVVALTRWENDSTPNMIGHLVEVDGTDCEYKFLSGSQDAWAFIAGEVPEVTIDIPMGEMGCDQVFLGWAVKSGCEVLCPSFDVRIKHIHANRNTYANVKAMSGFYAYPEITTLAGGVGLVCVHDFPSDDDSDAEFIATCPR